MGIFTPFRAKVLNTALCSFYLLNSWMNHRFVPVTLLQLLILHAVSTSLKVNLGRSVPLLAFSVILHAIFLRRWSLPKWQRLTKILAMYLLKNVLQFYLTIIPQESWKAVSKFYEQVASSWMRPEQYNVHISSSLLRITESKAQG